MGLFSKKEVVPNVDLLSITAQSIFLVEDSFFIKGLVKVTGVVKKGEFFPKKTYILIHNGNRKEVYIANIEQFLKAIDSAPVDTPAGFTLSNLIDNSEISKGDIIISNN